MTQVTQAAYMAALEKKLMEAERALYGFRAIWNNLQQQPREEGTIGRRDVKPPTPAKEDPRRSGLFAGQFDNYVDPEDMASPTPEECGKSEQECIE